MSDARVRLNALRRQSGSGPGAVDAGTRREALDALRRRIGHAAAGRRRPLPVHPPVDDGTLAARLGGRVLDAGLIAIREGIAPDTLHGDFPLADPAPGSGIVLGPVTGVATPDCVFMDTETTGLAGGTGTLAFLLGLARFRDGSLEVLQLLLTGFQGEGAMLDAAREYLRGADALVTFNGRSFDAPLLAARYRLAGCRDGFADLPHVDLLVPTRRAFRRRWPDCRLRTAEQRLLGVRRVGDLPGAEAPRAWFDWIRHGRDGDLAGVCAHNRLDLLSLVVLPVALQESHDNPIAAGADAHAWAMHRRQVIGGGCGEQAAFEYLRRHRAALEPHGLHELARLARRRRAWDVAVAIWEELAQAGDRAAIEHLAKYFEHEEKDLHRALEITARLIADAPTNRHHLRRDARLRGRLAASPY